MGPSYRPPAGRRGGQALGTLPAREAAPSPRDTLEHTDAAGRLEIARALAHMAAVEAVDWLTRVLDQETVPEVRDSLREALSVWRRRTPP